MGAADSTSLFSQSNFTTSMIGGGSQFSKIQRAQSDLVDSEEPRVDMNKFSSSIQKALA